MPLGGQIVVKAKCAKVIGQWRLRVCCKAGCVQTICSSKTGIVALAFRGHHRRHGGAYTNSTRIARRGAGCSTGIRTGKWVRVHISRTIFELEGALCQARCGYDCAHLVCLGITPRSILAKEKSLVAEDRAADVTAI